MQVRDIGGGAQIKTETEGLGRKESSPGKSNAISEKHGQLWGDQNGRDWQL